tara:strand:+ start:342 stop:545 length:204 start_codon:yes stop_codon:yes gene_type:complete
MRRRKHKNDHNHSKNGYVAGNPRYSRKGSKMKNNPDLVFAASVAVGFFLTGATIALAGIALEIIVLH